MKTIGYIVECHKHGAMLSAIDQQSGKPWLYFGSYATLFASRKKAQRAVERQIRANPEFEENFGKLFIRRVEADTTA